MNCFFCKLTRYFIDKLCFLLNFFTLNIEQTQFIFVLLIQVFTFHKVTNDLPGMCVLNISVIKIIFTFLTIEKKNPITCLIKSSFEFVLDLFFQKLQAVNLPIWKWFLTSSSIRINYFFDNLYLFSWNKCISNLNEISLCSFKRVFKEFIFESKYGIHIVRYSLVVVSMEYCRCKSLKITSS